MTERLLFIGMAVAWAYAFFEISIKGGYMAIEPNPYILRCEQGLFTGIALYGIIRYIQELKHGKAY